MAWTEEMPAILRVMIGDTGPTGTYTDAALAKQIAVATRQVLGDTDFEDDYLVPYSTGTQTFDIVPDPTIEPYRDEDLINLSTLKAACMLIQSNATLKANQAIRIKDVTSEIDLRGVPKAYVDLIKSGWCAVYKEALNNYDMSGAGTVGSAIVGPFRVYAQSSYYCR